MYNCIRISSRTVVYAFMITVTHALACLNYPPIADISLPTGSSMVTPVDSVVWFDGEPYSRDVDSVGTGHDIQQYYWDVYRQGSGTPITSVTFDYICEGSTFSQRFETSGTYYVKLRVKDNDGVMSTNTDTFTVYVQSPPRPPAVTNTNPENVTHESSVLKGAISSNGGTGPSAKIYWGDNDGGATTVWDNTDDLPSVAYGSLSYPVSGVLSAGSQYFYRFWGSDSEGGSWAVDTHKFITLPGQATSPSHDGVSSVPINVTLSWTDGAHVEPLKEHRLYWAPSSELYFDEPVIISSGTNFYALPPLNYGITYKWRVDEVIEDSYNGVDRVRTGPIWTFTVEPQPEYTLTVEVDGGGTADPSGLNPYLEGTEATVTATPNPGYKFDHWGEDFDSADGNTAIVVMDADKRITAYFVPYDLTIDTINCTVEKTFSETTAEYTLDVLPYEHCHWVRWEGDLSGTSDPYTIQINSDQRATALCQIDTCQLTDNVPVNGSILINPDSPDDMYPYGSTVTLTAEPNEGYVFDHWTVNGNDLVVNGTFDTDSDWVLEIDKVGIHDGYCKFGIWESGGTAYQAIAITAEKKYRVTFNVSNFINYSTLPTTCKLGGTAYEITGDGYYDIVLEAGSSDDYIMFGNSDPIDGGGMWIDNVTVWETTSSQANPLLLYMDEDKTVSASYDIKRALDLTVIGGASSILEGITYYPQGDEVIVGVSPLVGYGVVGWDVSGITPGDYQINGNTCTVTMNSDYTLAATCLPFVSNIIYVSPDGDNSDGLSWQTAFNHLQDALDIAVSGDQIWVAAHTYCPDEESIGSEHTPDLRTETFQLVSGVAVYGGFEGYETSIDQRKPGINLTILSGDIHQDDGSGLTGSNNSFHVVTGSNNVLLDGFMVIRGCADSGTASGGGGLLLNSNTSVVVRNCHFKFNRVDSDKEGGGILVIDSSGIEFVNCIYSENSSLTDTGSTVNYGDGGGIYVDNSTVEIINCTISNNVGLQGAGIYNDGNCSVVNSILWNNVDNEGLKSEPSQITNNTGATLSVNYSCIQGWTGALDPSGQGNISDDPGFEEEGNWQMAVFPDSIPLQGTIRDFHKKTFATYGHPDFEGTTGLEVGIVGNYGAPLDPDGKPDYDTTRTSTTTNGKAWFDMWFRDTPNYNQSGILDIALLPKTGDPGVYYFKDTSFFRIDDQYFGNEGNIHNYHFTMELHTTFYWDGESEYFEVYGSDDDLFIYIDGKLVMDIGGVHPPRYRKFEITADGKIKIYEPIPDDGTDPSSWTLINTDAPEWQSINELLTIDQGTHSFDLFFAERHTVQSNLKFETSIKLDSNLTAGDYHLLSGSPCIDAGDNAPVIAGGVSIDLDGNTRRIDDFSVIDTGITNKPIVDMGAYEYGVDDYDFDVYAGEDKTVTCDAQGSVTVDLWDAEVTSPYPVGDQSYLWSPEHVSATGTIDFGPDASELNPSVTLMVDPVAFGVRGHVVFVLKLSATDQVGEGEDTIRITVFKEGFTHQRPQVTVDGPYVVEMADLPLTMTGTISDDGEPVGGLTGGWIVINSSSGGGAEFSPKTYRATDGHRDDSGRISMAVSSDVTFTQPGSYLIKLAATDGELSHEAVTSVEVIRDNNPPTVEAGAYTDIVPDAYPYVLDLQNDPYVTLKPSVVDEGLVGPVKKSWRVISGPINGMLYDTKDALSKLTFSKTGEYIVQLVADDGQYTVTDQATIKLLRVPQVEAGHNKNAVFATGGVTINMSDAWVRDNYPEIPNNDLTIKWKVIDPLGSGNVVFEAKPSDTITQTGEVTFTSSDDVARGVTFLAIGDYELQLSATDPDGTLSGHTMTDTVRVMVTKPPVFTTALYAGGSQKSPSGNGAVVYRKYPGSDWEAISGEMGDAVLCLCAYNGELYAGTMVSTGEAEVRKWDGATGWSLVSDGWGTNTVMRVYSLVVYNGCLFAGTDAPDVLFKYNGSQWEEIAVSDHTSGIRSMYVWNGRLYLDVNKKDDIDYYDSSGYHPQTP